MYAVMMMYFFCLIGTEKCRDKTAQQLLLNRDKSFYPHTVRTRGGFFIHLLLQWKSDGGVLLCETILSNILCSARLRGYQDSLHPRRITSHCWSDSWSFIEARSLSEYSSELYALPNLTSCYFEDFSARWIKIDSKKICEYHSALPWVIGKQKKESIACSPHTEVEEVRNNRCRKEMSGCTRHNKVLDLLRPWRLYTTNI